MASAIKRYLEALECPFLNDIENLHSLSNQELIINWLEDRKIREYEIEKRLKLKFGDSISAWNQNISDYLALLNCPIAWTAQVGDTIPPTNQQALIWLLSKAISLDYEDSLDQMDTEDNEEELESGVTIADSTLANKINELGSVLKLSRKTNESSSGNTLTFVLYLYFLLLPHICLYLEYVRRIAEKIKYVYFSKEKTSNCFLLKDFPLGFDTKGIFLNKYFDFLHNILSYFCISL